MSIDVIIGIIFWGFVIVSIVSSVVAQGRKESARKVDGRPTSRPAPSSRKPPARESSRESFSPASTSHETARSERDKPAVNRGRSLEELAAERRRRLQEMQRQAGNMPQTGGGTQARMSPPQAPPQRPQPPQVPRSQQSPAMPPRIPGRQSAGQPARPPAVPGRPASTARQPFPAPPAPPSQSGSRRTVAPARQSTSSPQQPARQPANTGRNQPAASRPTRSTAPQPSASTSRGRTAAASPFAGQVVQTKSDLARSLGQGGPCVQVLGQPIEEGANVGLAVRAKMSDRRQWREAIVMKELLDFPLALRNADRQPGES